MAILLKYLYQADGRYYQHLQVKLLLLKDVHEFLLLLDISYSEVKLCPQRGHKEWEGKAQRSFMP